MKTWICTLAGCALAAACSSHESKPPTDATQYAHTEEPQSPSPSTKPNPSPNTGPSRALRESQFGQLSVVPPASSSESASAEPSEEDPNAGTIRTNRDAPETAPPPSDQSPAAWQQPPPNNDQSDLQVTQKIREAVLGHGSLSFAAKNVTIATENGRVTLRGVVPSDDERRIVADEARRIAGNDRVDDQIEVKNE